MYNKSIDKQEGNMTIEQAWLATAGGKVKIWVVTNENGQRTISFEQPK